MLAPDARAILREPRVPLALRAAAREYHRTDAIIRPVQTVLITGASSGIGQELAAKYLHRGDRVTVLSRRAEDTAAALPGNASNLLALNCDVQDAASTQAAVEKARMQFGDFDIVIANAGVSIPTPARKFHLDDAIRVLRTNVEGTLNLFAATIPHMVERQSGRFVGIASIAGLRGLPTSGAYSASKAAMQSFLEAARIELAPKKVGVTIVNPGFVKTPMTEKNRFPMPFLMEPAAAADVIIRGIDAGKRVLEFPLPMSLFMRLMRIMPDAVYEVMMKPYASREIDPSKFKR